MSEVTVTGEITVRCGTCGRELSADWRDETYRSGPFLQVDPCEVCIDAAHDRGLDEGYEKGINEETTP